MSPFLSLHEKIPPWAEGVHHDGSEVFVSNPLPALNESLTVWLRAPFNAPLNHVYWRGTVDGEVSYVELSPMRQDSVSVWYAGEITITQPRLDYRFKLLTPDGAYYLNARGLSRAESPNFDDFTLLAGYDAPLWVREQVFYQIFPDRFRNGDLTLDVQDDEWVYDGHSTQRQAWGDQPLAWRKAGSLDFFNGDLPGITQKLDYLRDLGVTALYLTPIFEARTNHRYDITDYSRVDPHLGGDQALAELRAALDAHGMKLMLDVTPNHLGMEHPWLQTALADDNAPTRSYFYFDEQGHYERWLGVPILAKLNYGSVALREAMYRAPDSVLQRWRKEPYRIDAWRLDVANMTGNFHQDQHNLEVMQDIRRTLKPPQSDFYLLGEYFMDAAHVLQGDALDASMNYYGFNIPARRWLGADTQHAQSDQGDPHGDPHPMPAEAVVAQMRRVLASYPYAIALQQFNQIGSHDIPRPLWVAGGDQALLKLGTAFLMAYPGVPCVYYGDEVGLMGGTDPDNRQCMPWDESEWDHELRAYHQRLMQIRRESHALQHGGLQFLHAEDDLIVFQRQSTRERVLFVGHRGDALPELRLKVRHAGIADGVHLRDALSEAEVTVQQGEIVLNGVQHGQACLLIAQG